MTQRMLGAPQLIVLSLVLAFGLASELYSQELVGRITGQLVDEADNVLPGTRVFITNLQSRAYYGLHRRLGNLLGRARAWDLLGSV